MRAVVVAMVIAALLAGCGADTWRRIDVRTVNDEAPDQLFVMTENDAYVLETPHVDNDVLRGHVARSWRIKRPAASTAHQVRDPEDIAAEGSWRAGNIGTDVEVRLDALYVTKKHEDASLAPRVAGAVVLLSFFAFLIYGGQQTFGFVD